ncbi:hypothetical protein PUNSTDRAFT_114540 [Punctularia strigosozonata HHB-11173 SS5]|uniref:uncharacterized protein n=1 Tax=Punctularia strigosozonata (strain HHB-11173) TaxID=741275 RepID=UPI0004417A1A|nr:uncharacterized protein PUNSTDRAFT_114540 [Punctularia strigosozonata HHB-11173 SS5]EIN07037.1 hypothetical protein PUNSTDRAFT_114540 [Punctularia strigosozonata HHB-11173 SS5]
MLEKTAKDVPLGSYAARAVAESTYESVIGLNDHPALLCSLSARAGLEVLSAGDVSGHRRLPHYSLAPDACLPAITICIEGSLKTNKARHPRRDSSARGRSRQYQRYPSCTCFQPLVIQPATSAS